MEQAFSHNQVKTVIARTLLSLAESLDAGRFFGDGMSGHTHPFEADLDTIPDGMYISFESIKGASFDQSPDERPASPNTKGRPTSGIGSCQR